MLEVYHAVWVAASAAMDVLDNPKTGQLLKLGDSSLSLRETSPDEREILKQFYMKVGERAERRVRAMQGRQK